MNYFPLLYISGVIFSFIFVLLSLESANKLETTVNGLIGSVREVERVTVNTRRHIQVGNAVSRVCVKLIAHWVGCICICPMNCKVGRSED